MYAAHRATARGGHRGIHEDRHDRVDALVISYVDQSQLSHQRVQNGLRHAIRGKVWSRRRLRRTKVESEPPCCWSSGLISRVIVDTWLVTQVPSAGLWLVVADGIKFEFTEQFALVFGDDPEYCAGG